MLLRDTFLAFERNRDIYLELKAPQEFLCDSVLAGWGPTVAPSFALFNALLLAFSLRIDTLLDTDSRSPERKTPATVGSCLNYAKYRIFCAILKVRQIPLWQSLPHSPTGRSCQTPPFLLCLEKWKARKKRHNGECISTAGVQRRGVRSPQRGPHFAWNRWETLLFSSRC